MAAVHLKRREKTSSNTPELFDNNGVAMIRLYHHGSAYTVRCRVERVI